VITIEEHGLAGVRDRFAAMWVRGQDLSPAWEEFLTWWTIGNKEHFASRGARWRTPWKPLAPRTVREKRSQGWMADPLVRTTRLRGELVRRPLGVEHITAGAVTAGTNLDYAIYHQRGAPRAHLPRRPLINADAVAREGAASSVVITWIVNGVPDISGALRLEG
jgi:hypothetical protein